MYVKLVKNEINNVIKYLTICMQESQSIVTTKQMLLEVLKLRIRGVTIPYCARQKKNKRERKKVGGGNLKFRPLHCWKHWKWGNYKSKRIKSRVKETEGNKIEGQSAEIKNTELHWFWKA